MALGKDLLLAGGLGGAMLLAIIVANSGSDAPVQTAPPVPLPVPDIPRTAVPVPAALPVILPEQVGMVEPVHQADVAGMLNLLRETVPECREALSPMNAGPASVQPEPGNPHFFVFCGNQMRKKINFTWMDAVNKRVPAPAPRVDRTAAVNACESRAKSWATNPQTVSFSRVLDMDFRDHGDGSATIRSAFTAKNAFNLELKFAISCEYAGGRITHSSVSEYQ